MPSGIDPSALARLPKAELHAHLEGTVFPATLRELALRNGVQLDAPTIFPGYGPIPAPRLEFPFHGDFRDFIALYVKISSCLKSADDLATLARDYVDAAVQDGIVAAELYVTPTTLMALGLSEAELASGLHRAEATAGEQGVQLSWIFDIVRNSPLPGEPTVEVATRLRDEGVRVQAIGLGGLEAGYPSARFRDAFRTARDRGFNILAHAGETAGAESIWETLENVQPTRIGHGIRAIDDPKLLEQLKRLEITLEVSPWSNLLLQNATEENHPLTALLAAGIDLVLAADDPGIFGRTLGDNFAWARDHGVSNTILEGLAARSIELCGKRGQTP